MLYGQRIDKRPFFPLCVGPHGRGGAWQNGEWNTKPPLQAEFLDPPICDTISKKAPGRLGGWAIALDMHISNPTGVEVDQWCRVKSPTHLQIAPCWRRIQPA